TMNYLTEYSTFNNTQELNAAIGDHIELNQHELNETARDVFMLISQYSVKYNGVAHLKIDTIANIIGKSGRTVQRAIRTLEQLGMIERLEFMRNVTGGNGANIYVIPSLSCRAEADNARYDNDNPIDEPNESIKLLSSNNTDDTADAERIINESITNNTPREIVDLFRPFFYGSELYRYIGLLFKAKYRPHASIRIEEHIEDYKACIYDVMRRHKAGIVRNLDGYLF